MIVHGDAGSLRFITQSDHAALAARLMAAWQADGLPDSPRRKAILTATENHDNGWRDEDEAPLLDAAGRVLDFMTAPDVVRQGVWPRGVATLRGMPYAAALVAQHAITVNEPNRVYPHWGPFFEGMEQQRDDQLARAAPLTIENLRTDYFFVRMGDLMSLTFCCGWEEPRQHGRYEVRWTGSRLIVHPDPFGGRMVAMSIPVRRIVGRPAAAVQDEAADLRREFARTPVSTLTGIASGAA